MKDAEKEKVVSSPLKGHGSKSFASRGGVKEHGNMDGPACPKCGQVCKNKEGLRNHMLSHYYEVFFEVGRVLDNIDICVAGNIFLTHNIKVLPGVAPFTCPECDKDASRDRITLTRHYAFAHNKLFEMTDVTPEMLNPSNSTNHNMELKKFARKEQDDEGVVKQNNQSEDRVDVKQKKVEVKLEMKGGLKLEKKEEFKMEKEFKMDKEQLKLKESVAALSVKSDNNFVQWQKTFGKHYAQSDGSKKRNREKETKVQRRDRKEKKRVERREAERREDRRWEEEEEEKQIEVKSEVKKEEVRSEGCNNNEVKNSKKVPAKPLFSLMMQELDNPSSCIVTKVGGLICNLLLLEPPNTNI